MWHEEFKRDIKTQTALPCAETAAMLFWALLASGQITTPRLTDGRASPRNRPVTSLTSPHDRIASCCPKDARQPIPTHIATRLKFHGLFIDVAREVVRERQWNSPRRRRIWSI
jgi:hypothetical protein